MGNDYQGEREKQEAVIEALEQVIMKMEQYQEETRLESAELHEQFQQAYSEYCNIFKQAG